MTESTTVSIPGYRILETILKSASNAVYRAVREKDRLPVVLKLLLPEHASPMELSRYRNEYETLRSLDSKYVVKALGLESFRQTAFLVLEDTVGTPLDLLMEQWARVGSEAFPMKTFFAIALRIVDGLADVHAAGIVHRDLCPANIVWNPGTEELRFADLSRATTLSLETLSAGSPRLLEGTLAYLAPEQTGRTNRNVDYRADFYALGAILYEMLAGRPPFDSDDPMELVHCHLARTPGPVHRVNPHVPHALSDIVAKLLAKGPEDRYQSARGLRHDLEICRDRCASDGTAPSFPLGTRDRAERFLIPEKLYGREREVADLMASFERAAGGKVEMVLVAGPPGIGKTSVVREIHAPVVRKRAFFIQGKYDQIGRAVPFSAFVKAMRDLLTQVLEEDDPSVDRLRMEIRSALGSNAQVLIDVMPELERLIGEQPPVPDLSGNAAQIRFHLMFRKLILSFATAEHPLVVFLDDLQWADLASLMLIQFLVGHAPSGFLLLVGAYRDEEVPRSHPLWTTLEEIAGLGMKPVTIAPAPLTEADTCLLVAETLGCSREAAMPLASLAFRKTRGNPFFTTRFLKALHEDGVIAYNGETERWECDMVRVASLALTDDVVELLTQQLRKLPAAVQTALQWASCIGGTFDLGTLAIVCKKNQVETAADLWPALQAGMVVPIGKVYRFYLGEGETGDPFRGGSPMPTYRFLHDRAQQAAYSSIAEESRPAAHLRIGRFLLAGSTEAQQEEKIFEIVSQYNRGIYLMDDPAERRTLALWNLRAGRKAKAATAFRTALEYFTAGRRLLPADCWRVEYALALDLYVSSVETAYLCGDMERMGDLADVVLREAMSMADKVRVHEVQFEVLAARNRMRESVESGLAILESLGVRLPLEPGGDDIGSALERTRSMHEGRRIADLIGLPSMGDPGQLVIMRILAGISAAAFLSAPRLYVLLILMQVRMSIEHGVTAASAFAFASYGLILCSDAGGIEAGNEFGQLALELVQRLDARELQCKVPSIVNTFVTHWRSHIRDCLPPLLSAYHTGLEIGDLQFAGYSAILYVAYQFAAGIDKGLQELQGEIDALDESMGRWKQWTVSGYFRMLAQAVHDLRRGRNSPDLLQGDRYDERAMMPRHEESKDWNGIFYVHLYKLILSVLFGQYREAVRDASETERYVDKAAGFPYPPVFRLYDSLARLAAHRTAPQEGSDALLARIGRNREMLETWARYAPMNNRHRVDLVDAERERTFGDPWNAMEAYGRAIAGAREHGFLREEALANELAAAFHRERGNEFVARAYLREARARYARWGADAVVARLEAGDPWLAASDGKAREPAEGSTAGLAAAETIGSMLDLATVVKAMQAIAGEIELPRLLRELMRIALENAGAGQGALVMERDGAWRIEVLGSVEGGVGEPRSMDLGSSDTVSADVVLAVARTKRSVTLADASSSPEFAHDPRIARGGVLSVLCTPLVNQGKISGILYLENNLVRGVFSPERLELLNLLSSQMALSLDAARQFQRAQQEIAERKQAEEALWESEQRFRTIFDSVNDAIFVHEPDSGNIVDVNRTTCAMYGYTREEILGMTVGALSAGEAPFTQREAMVRMKAAAGGTPQVFEWKAKRRDGSVFWVEIGIRRALINGKDRLLVVARDISERRLLNETLEKRVEERTAQLEAANREMEAFSYTVSHDLRAPLRAIEGFTRILEEDYGSRLDDEGRRVSSVIRRNTRRMDQLINDLLAFSRLGRAAMHCEPLDMRSIVDSVLGELVEERDRGRLDLRIGDLPKAMGDPAMIRQVWLNLIANALKFSSRRERAVIEIQGRVDEAGMEYSVTDNGAGFDARFSDKLFGVFQRLHGEREFEGTGVGLAIVRRAVQRHGGSVRAEGEPDRGATFRFTLPGKGAVP